MIVIDTNVLLHAADTSSEYHAPCRRLLEHARASTTPWFLTWGILYEFLRVATHPRVYARPRSAAEAYAFVDALMREHGISRIVTRDRDFHQFAFLTVIDPLRAASTS